MLTVYLKNNGVNAYSFHGKMTEL